MSWPFQRRELKFLDATGLVDQRTAGRTTSHRQVSRDHALSHSAVWACLRLRADLVSTMPMDVFRMYGGVQVEAPKPPVLITPGGDKCRWMEWVYSTQFDLDSCGNTFGLITERMRDDRPAVIELVPYSDVTVQLRKGVLNYRIAGIEYDAQDVWHEKQFTTSGMPVGLSPIAAAAMSIGGYLSAQAFAQDWFTNGGVPASHLKNTAKVLDFDESAKVKEKYKASVTNGDVFVTGADWDFNLIAAKASETQFIEERKFGVSDVCRYLGVPGDMIDAETSTGSITYANITQRNLQLLITNLNPALRRREDAFSFALMPQPRFAKFNRAAILEMDLKSRYESYAIGITSRFLAPSEARALENRPPFTPDQLTEIKDMFPPKQLTPVGGLPS